METEVWYAIAGYVLGVIIYVLGHIVSDKKAKDPFQWGAFTGMIMFAIVSVSVNILIK